MSKTFNEANMTDRLEQHWKNYKPQIEALEKSTINHIKGVTDYDRFVLGESLNKVSGLFNWLKNKRKVESFDGSYPDLGVVPQAALDLVTVFYGESIVPLIASVQPIDEEIGIVYFKQIIAKQKRGNRVADQVIRDPRMKTSQSYGYASERVEGIKLATTTADTTAYTGTLTGIPLPIRPGTVTIEFNDGTNTARGVDQQMPAKEGQTPPRKGYILGYGIQGTIDYTTGAYEIDFVGFTPVADKDILLSAGSNFEASESIPMIQAGLDSMPIKAQIYALGSEIGLFKEFALSKRFGKVGMDEMLTDLSDEMVAEGGRTVITKLINAQLAGTDITWDRKPGTGVSWFEHKQQLADKISEVEAKMLETTGRGTVNCLIAGSLAASNLSNLPGFERVVTGDNIGPHVFGTFNGITVIRDVEQDQNKIYAVYRGSSPFEAPCVWAPFLPLTVTGELTYGANPLLKQGLAAMWAGCESVIPGFLGSITITES